MRNPLHIRCGDDILGKLREAGLPGRMMKWCDPLSRGPTPSVPTKDEWYAMRAAYVAASYHLQIAEVESDLRLQDEELSAFKLHDAVLLWFEHDLFDQIILVYLLDWFSREDMQDTVLRLICIDGYPGVDRFIGLGNLSAGQLATLYPMSQPVTRSQLTLARDAWASWCSPTPERLLNLLSADTSALPFLHAAIVRHLEEFPSTRNGIGRTEQMTLNAISEGYSAKDDIFRHVQDREEAPWMGDTMLWAELDALQRGRTPLIYGNGSGLRLTEAGEMVGAYRADYLALNELHMWRAGVHLTPANLWRWNPDTRALAIQ
ncbi:MAG: hypothetical protein M3Z36_05085 [Acidobacteriota bacterium]|nr:hypothetical protein [Acidobacteriota bacterium]